MFFLVSFFFFQAEDGIRDGRVTGVQTCALPISFALRPVTRLAGVAHQLAAGTPATVPYAKRRDEAGQLARALASYRDVEARQRAIFQRAPIGLLTAGGDGRVWESNPAFQQM